MSLYKVPQPLLCWPRRLLEILEHLAPLQWICSGAELLTSSELGEGLRHRRWSNGLLIHERASRSVALISLPAFACDDFSLYGSLLDFT